MIEFLDHTADLMFRVKTSNEKELFKELIIALRKSFTEKEVSIDEKREIVVEGMDNEQLLFNLFDELIFLFDTESLIPVEIINIKEIDLNNHKLKFVIGFHKKRHNEEVTGIKAVTYHDLKIEKIGNEWIAQVVLDI